MKNGQKEFAPETGLGTGALNPVADEYELAVQVPSVDESTLGKGNRSANQPSGSRTIESSGEDVGDSGTGEVKSTGEDNEVRTVLEDGHADDAEANQLAADVRPEAPQAEKASRKRKSDA